MMYWIFWRRAAHLRARSELLLAHMAAACPPLLCALTRYSMYGFGLAHVLISFQKPTKKRHIPHKLGARTKSSHFPHCILSGYHFFFLNTAQGSYTNTHIMTHLLRWWGGVLWAFKRRKYRNRENVRCWVT